MNLLNTDFELPFLPTVVVVFCLLIFAAFLADSQDVGYLERHAAAGVFDAQDN